MKTKVIDSKNLPVNPFKLIWNAILLYLFLDKMNFDELINGIVYGFFALVYIIAIISFFAQEKVDIFNKIK